MAGQQQERLTPKQQALRDLEDARASLAYHASHAAEDWSPKAIFTRSVEKHRAVWLGAAALAGVALLKSLWPSGGGGSRHEGHFAGVKNRGLFALLLSPLLAFARKSALNYGAQMFESYLRQKVSPNEPGAGAV
ncbi:hypothetical protein [Prosthecobacter sp.]|uniref:hypothetical protein n=1 Tax=Prosthecobacter sp. TaxID=1965333 RepID=UPI0037833E4D